METANLHFGRRRVLETSALAAGAATLALACSGESKDPQDANRSSRDIGAAAAKQPKRGGTLVVDSGVEPQPNALVYQFNPSNVYLRWGIWDSLVYVDNEGKLQPMLAEAFELRPDFTGVHVKLRAGVTWHSGRPFTAEDVKFTIESFSADNVSSQAKSAMKAIREVKITDPLTLDISWGEPRLVYEDYFAMVPIIDKDTVAQAEQMKTLVGTGPFKFVSYTPQQGYLMERNPNYWDQGKPYLDRIQGKRYSDDEARALALQTGELMHHTSASYAIIKKLRNNKDLTILDGGIGGNSLLGLAVTYPPLRDVRVRQALTLAIDRGRIAKEWAEGIVKPRNLPWPIGSPADIAEDEAVLKYDPERAKSLIKAAGAEGFTLPTDTTAEIVDLLPYVQDMYKAIGVNQQLNMMESGAWSDRRRQGKFDASWGPAHSLGFNTLQPATLFDAALIVTVPNTSHYEPPGYKELLQKVKTLDPKSPAGREALSQWNRRFLIDDPWLIPLCPVTAFDIARAEVKITPEGHGPGKHVPLADAWIDK